MLFIIFQQVDLSTNSIESPLSCGGNKNSSVTRLDLSRNRISKIGARAFRGFIDLKELILAGNSIQTLDPLSFGSLAILHSLDLSSNGLGELPPTLGSAATVKKLSISGNVLGCFPAGFFKGLPGKFGNLGVSVVTYGRLCVVYSSYSG